MKRILDCLFAFVALLSLFTSYSASARVSQKVVRREYQCVKASELDLYSGVICYGFNKKDFLVDSTFYDLKKDPDLSIPEVKDAWEHNRLSLMRIISALRSNKRNSYQINEVANNYAKQWVSDENALRLKKKNVLVDSLVKEKLPAFIADSVATIEKYREEYKDYVKSVKSYTYAISSIEGVNSLGGVTTRYFFSVKKPMRKIVLTRAFYNAWGERLRGEFAHQYSTIWTLEGKPGKTDNLYYFECDTEFYSKVADHVKIITAKVYYVDGTVDNAKVLNTAEEVAMFFPVKPEYPIVPSRVSLRNEVEMEVEGKNPELKKIGLYSAKYNEKMGEYKQQLTSENSYWETRVKSLLEEYSAYGLK